MQAVRGGRTKLAHLTAPQADYNHEEKGDALHAMELALSLEKLNFHKLRELHDVADATKDAQMADFVETMLAEQVCVSMSISMRLYYRTHAQQGSTTPSSTSKISLPAIT